MRRLILAFNALFWMFGCGGGGGGGGPTTPAVPPDIAGVWSGTETTVVRGGTECSGVTAGTVTASPMFNVTQNRQQIEIFQFVGCLVCQYTGTVAADGRFTATGTGPTYTIPMVGQVSGNRMMGTRGPPSFDCDATAQFDLTRG